jgi:hypothetical protein
MSLLLEPNGVVITPHVLSTHTCKRCTASRQFVFDFRTIFGTLCTHGEGRWCSKTPFERAGWSKRLPNRPLAAIRLSS